VRWEGLVCLGLLTLLVLVGRPRPSRLRSGSVLRDHPTPHDWSDEELTP
jgi:hypothetical protein